MIFAAENASSFSVATK